MLATKNLGPVGILVPVAVCAVVLAAGCSPPGTRAFLDGDRLMREGKYAPAIEKLKLATELLAEAWQPGAWNHLGLAHHHAGHAKEAIAAYQEALRRSPNLALARYNLGRLYLEQDNLPGAISELVAYTVLDPNFFPCWLKLGAALLRSRQFDEAEKCYRNALQLDASQPEALNGLGVIQVQRKRWRDALAYFSAALEKNSRYAPALLNLAIVYHQHFPNRQLALRQYREYLEVRPQPPNSSAVEAIVRQIEAELNPPPLLVQTNRPASFTNTTQAAGPFTNVVPQRTTMTSSPPLKSTNLPAQVQVEPKEEPPPRKLELVTLTNELPPKLPEDIPLPPTPPATNAPVAIEPDSSSGASALPTPLPPISPKIKPRNEGRSLLDRLNPRSWFRGKETPASTSPPQKPEQVVTTTPNTETRPMAKAVPSPQSGASLPPTPANIARYSYRQPAKPAAGDRGKAQSFFADGLKAHRERRLTAAIEAYREALRLDPSYYEANYNLGLAAYEAKDLGQSLIAYEYALALEPGSADARYNLALSLEQARFYLDAANELEKLLADRADETKAHFALAKLYGERLARIDLARTHYRRVLELEPQHPEASAIRYWLAAHP